MLRTMAVILVVVVESSVVLLTPPAPLITITPVTPLCHRSYIPANATGLKRLVRSVDEMKAALILLYHMSSL